MFETDGIDLASKGGNALKCIGCQKLINVKIRHGAIVENIVTDLCAKFNDDRL